VEREYEILYLDKLRFRKYVKLKVYNIEGTAPRRPCGRGRARTVLDKYLILIFYYTGFLKNLVKFISPV
jgi:hypothetical protein